MKKTRTEKFFMGAKVILTLIFLLVVLIAFLYRDKISLSTLLNFSPKNTNLAVVYILGCFIVKSLSIIFPIVVLFLFSGQMFNLSTALIVNLAGIIATVTVPYCIGKHLGIEMTEFLKKKYATVQKLDDFAKDNSYFFCYITRVVNILPGDIVSFYLGSTQVGYLKFLIGSLGGMLPTMITVTVMGDNITRLSSPQFLISLVITVIFSLLSIPIYKYSKNNKIDKHGDINKGD